MAKNIRPKLTLLQNIVMSFGPTLVLICHIICKFCTEHGSIISVLGANCLNDIWQKQRMFWTNDNSRNVNKNEFRTNILP